MASVRKRLEWLQSDRDKAFRDADARISKIKDALRIAGKRAGLEETYTVHFPERPAYGKFDVDKYMADLFLTVQNAKFVEAEARLSGKVKK